MMAKFFSALSRRVNAIPIDADIGITIANDSKIQSMLPPFHKVSLSALLYVSRVKLTLRTMLKILSNEIK